MLWTATTTLLYRQTPDIGSFVSQANISLTPFSDQNLSELYNNSNEIIIPFDNCAETLVENIQMKSVELVQDVAIESAIIDEDRQLNTKMNAEVDANIKTSTKSNEINTKTVFSKEIKQ